MMTDKHKFAYARKDLLRIIKLSRTLDQLILNMKGLYTQWTGIDAETLVSKSKSTDNQIPMQQKTYVTLSTTTSVPTIPEQPSGINAKTPQEPIPAIGTKNIRCPHCNELINYSEDIIFCPNCGVPID